MSTVVINTEDIVGYIVDEEWVCNDCSSREEKAEASQEEIITCDDMEGDKIYFCDRCKERIG
jgi:hypothetical protein